MSDIAEFLRARYAEQRALAEAARDGNWDFKPYPPLEVGGDPVKYEAMMARVRFVEALQPSQVLADLDAKLAILDEHPATRDVIAEKPDGLHGFGCATCHQDEGLIIGYGWCRTLRLLAVPFAAHPDYDERWRP